MNQLPVSDNDKKVPIYTNDKNSDECFTFANNLAANSAENSVAGPVAGQDSDYAVRTQRSAMIYSKCFVKRRKVTTHTIHICVIKMTVRK